MVEVLETGQDQQQLFVRELQVGSRLNHPNVVRCLGFCVSPLALVLEYVPGRELFDALHDPNVAYNWVRNQLHGPMEAARR